MCRAVSSLSVARLLSHISLLSLSSCVALQERKARTRAPISSVAPPPAAAAPPRAEPVHPATRSSVHLWQGAEGYAAKGRPRCVNRTPMHVTCASPSRCVTCLMSVWGLHGSSLYSAHVKPSLSVLRCPTHACPGSRSHVSSHFSSPVPTPL